MYVLQIQKPKKRKLGKLSNAILAPFDSFFFLITSESVSIRRHCPGNKMGSYFSPTYLLTPWCRVLLEKLIGLQLVQKFPAFYGTRRFITALTSFRHLSLSWASPIQSTYPHPSSWRSILILSTHLRQGRPSGSKFDVAWTRTRNDDIRKLFLLNIG